MALMLLMRRQGITNDKTPEDNKCEAFPLQQSNNQPFQLYWAITCKQFDGGVEEHGWLLCFRGEIVVESSWSSLNDVKR